MYPFTYWSPLYVVYTPESVTIPRPFDVMRTLYRRGTDASQSREYPVLPFLLFFSSFYCLYSTTSVLYTPGSL